MKMSPAQDKDKEEKAEAKKHNREEQEEGEEGVALAKKAKVEEAGDGAAELPEAEWRTAVREAYGGDMPEDFFAFWTFCRERNPERPAEAIREATGLRLVGPFDVLAGKKADKPEDYLVNWRYYYDVPEFTTVLARVGCQKGEGDAADGAAKKESQFHFGYFRDDPASPPAFVASNDPSAEGAASCKLTMCGDNLFGAVYNHIGALIQEASDPFRQTALQKLKERVHVYATMKVPQFDFSLDAKTRQMKARDKTKLAATFHGAGMVVPYNKESQVGYREIPETAASLRKIFKNVVEAETQEEKDKAGDVLQELITNVQVFNIFKIKNQYISHRFLILRFLVSSSPTTRAIPAWVWSLGLTPSATAGSSSTLPSSTCSV